MKTHGNEILLIYDPDTNTGKMCKAYALSITQHVNLVDIHKIKYTSTIWKQILTMLNLRPKDLLNKAHPYYQSNIRGRDFDEEGWLNILIRNPELIKGPIAIRNKTAVFCTSPSDLYRLSTKTPEATPKS